MRENTKGEALAGLCSHQLPKFTFRSKLMKKIRNWKPLQFLSLMAQAWDDAGVRMYMTYFQSSKKAS